MFRIEIDGVLIDDISLIDTDCFVLDPNLSQSVNSAGTLTFKMEPTHPCYENTFHKLSSFVYVYKDDSTDVYWKGRILDTKRNFDNEVEYTCEGELAFYNDILLPPYDFEYGVPIKDLFSWLVGKYNDNCTKERRIWLGNCTMTGKVYQKNESYSNVMTEMTAMVNTCGGYLSLRHVGTKTYIDYTEESGPVLNQTIEFGKNLLNLDEHIDATSVYTYLYPEGAIINSETNVRLTIESVNNGLKYVKSNTGESLYGKIENHIVIDDVTDPNELKTMAQEIVDAAVEEAIEITISAVDLSWIEAELDAFVVGAKVPILSTPHNIDGVSIISETSMNLHDASGNTYTFGNIKNRLTDQIVSQSISSTKKTHEIVNQSIAVNNEYTSTNMFKAGYGISITDSTISLNLDKAEDQEL